jgi:hypothetical protein
VNKLGHARHAKEKIATYFPSIHGVKRTKRGTTAALLPTNITDAFGIVFQSTPRLFSFPQTAPAPPSLWDEILVPPPLHLTPPFFQAMFPQQLQHAT